MASGLSNEVYRDLDGDRYFVIEEPDGLYAAFTPSGIRVPSGTVFIEQCKASPPTGSRLRPSSPSSAVCQR